MYVCERRMYVCERARMNYVLYGPSYKQAGFSCFYKHSQLSSIFSFISFYFLLFFVVVCFQFLHYSVELSVVTTKVML